MQTKRHNTVLAEKSAFDLSLDDVAQDDVAQDGVAQEKLAQNDAAADRNHLLARAVENSGALVAMGDREGRLTFANHAFLRALGYTLNEIQGRDFASVLSRRNTPALIDEIRTRSGQANGWNGECWVTRRDGTDIPVRLSAGRVRDESGRVLGSYGIADDISELKQAEENLRRSEAQFRELAENIREVFFMSTPEPSLLYVSPAYDEIWGRPRRDLFERPDGWLSAVIDGVHPDDRSQVRPALEQACRGEAVEFECRILRPDGAIRWIQSRYFPVNDRAGKFYRFVGTAEDVTQAKQSEEALRQAHSRLNRTLQEAELRARENTLLTELVDVLQSCQSVEEACKVMSSGLGSFFGGRPGMLAIMRSSRNVLEVGALWGQTPVRERTFAPDDCWAMRRGKINTVESAASPLRCTHPGVTEGSYVCVPLIAQGETLGVLTQQLSPAGVHGKVDGKRSVASDEDAAALERQAVAGATRMSLALANVRLREVLRHQSIRDPLTGLFNRRYMEETLERELERAGRRRVGVAVAMIDLDRFKHFNDSFGHNAGDLALREVAGVLQSSVRTGDDICCRFGGEELVLIVPDINAEAALDRLDLIRQEVRNLALGGRGQTFGKVTISVGLAMYPNDGACADELLHAADQALYLAKSRGRNRVVLAGENSSTVFATSA